MVPNPGANGGGKQGGDSKGGGKKGADQQANTGASGKKGGSNGSGTGHQGSVTGASVQSGAPPATTLASAHTTTATPPANTMQHVQPTQPAPVITTMPTTVSAAEVEMEAVDPEDRIYEEMDCINSHITALDNGAETETSLGWIRELEAKRQCLRIAITRTKAPEDQVKIHKARFDRSQVALAESRDIVRQIQQDLAEAEQKHTDAQAINLAIVQDLKVAQDECDALQQIDAVTSALSVAPAVLSTADTLSAAAGSCIGSQARIRPRRHG
jgi:hypothetical protein